MEKRNVMKSGVLWNEVMTAVHKREYPDVTLEHQLADSGGNFRFNGLAAGTYTGNLTVTGGTGANTITAATMARRSARAGNAPASAPANTSLC